MRSESDVQQLIMMRAPKFSNMLLRNNSGALTDKEGRLVRYGLGNVSKQHNEVFKSSDLIGIKSVVITPEMVGKTVGVFTAVECKAEGWKRSKKNKKEQAQSNFIEWVKNRGGIAGFASSLEEYQQLIEYQNGL